MDLPITLQMQIDLSAAAHKRELTDAFSELRAKLLPERELSPMEKLQRAMQQALLTNVPGWGIPNLAPANQQAPNQLMLQNQPWWETGGTGYSLFGGLFGTWR